MSAPTPATTTASKPEVIDVRSDTVTKPTPAMRAAMAAAEVGDDVFGDDPTVNKLQADVAKLLGKEAGLFVSSGTQGNLICVLLHCDGRGAEMIVGDQSHIFYYEQGNAAQFGGVHTRTVKNEADGTMNLEAIEKSIRPVDDHATQTQLIVVENTQNRCGGRVITTEYTNAVAAIAKKHNVKFHIDGARLFNASEALGIPAKDLVAQADSATICLSKGLGAPIGSVIVGSTDFIRRARRLRKALGGGMRQVGMIAAAGQVAIETMIKRLPEDHKHAKEIAQGLRTTPGFIVPSDADIHTNLLFVQLDATKLSCTAAQLVADLKAQHILTTATDAMTLRFVTHYMVTQESVKRILEVVQEQVKKYVK